MSYPDEVRPPLRAPQEPDAHDAFLRDVERPRILADAREAMRSLTSAILREYEHQRRRGLSPVFDVEPEDARRRPGITLDPEPRTAIDDYLDRLGYTAKR